MVGDPSDIPVIDLFFEIVCHLYHLIVDFAEPSHPGHTAIAGAAQILALADPLRSD